MLNRYFGLVALSVFFLEPCSGADIFSPREKRYQIHPGDIVAVTYRYSPEYNATVSVQPDGYAALPLLGDLRLGGLTLSEAHSRLVSKASERLNDPEINLDLKEFEKPYYVVGGEVAAPGKFEIHGRITALRAVELAGGFKTSAKISRVLLIRPVDDINAQTKLIDLKRLIDQHQPDEDIELRAGDVLIVPKTWVAKVEPYVKLANLGLFFNPLNF